MGDPTQAPHEDPLVLLLRVVRDALGELEVGYPPDSIVDAALTLADDSFDAADSMQLKLFIYGPLSDALERAVEAEDLDVVLDRLRVSYDSVPPPPDSGVEITSESEPPQEPSDSGVYGMSAASRAQAGPLTIMLLTSDERLRINICEALAGSGHTVVSSPDAATCVVHCASTLPALVICDRWALGSDYGQFLRVLERSLGPSAPATLLLTDEEPPADAPIAMLTRHPLHETALLDMVAELLDQIEVDDAVDMDQPGRDEAMRQAFESLVSEALDQVVTCDSRDGLVGEALGRAGLDEFPADLVAFARFLATPLKATICDHVGDDEAEAVLERLQPIVAQVRSTSIPPPPKPKPRRN